MPRRVRSRPCIHGGSTDGTRQIEDVGWAYARCRHNVEAAPRACAGGACTADPIFLVGSRGYCGQHARERLRRTGLDMAKTERRGSPPARPWLDALGTK